MSRFALHNLSLIIDNKQVDNQAVIINDGSIEDIFPQASLPGDMPITDCQDHLLVAGFIDTQVNGGGGVMFNDQPNVQGIDTIRRGHWSGGTTAMLPTLITDTDEKMQQAVSAIAQAIEVELPGIVGIHLEGPHLSLAKRGVHSTEQIRPFEAATSDLLSVLPADKYLITVAPETLAPGTIRQLSQRGIRVSAGHTTANYQQIKAALAEGLSCFTHLYNAMTPVTSREPGTVGAALDDNDSYCGIIIDGHHLHPITAKLAIASKAKGKMMLVTDAMATVGSLQGSFQLYGETIYAIDGRCAKSDGTLAGSALDMVSAVRNCVELLDIPLAEALRMASLYPAQFLGIDDRYGQILPNYRADMVLLDKQLQVQKTWVSGELCFSRR